MNNERFIKLVEMWLDSDIDDEDRRSLEATLVQDCSARQQFWKLSSLHSDLEIAAKLEWDAPDVAIPRDRGQFISTRAHHEDCDSERAKLAIVQSELSAANISSTIHQPFMTSADLVASGPHSEWLWRDKSASLYLNAGLAALSLTLAILFWRSPIVGSDESASTAKLKQDAASPPVAFLTDSDSCNWRGDTARLTTLCNSVNLGEDVTLYEGIARFRLASGVQLSLEGPASVVLNSPSSFVLLYGKVTVVVPSTVINFRINAAACQFSAHKAEFGIVQQGNNLDVHVFKGDIRAASPLMDRDDQHNKYIDGGSVIVDDTGVFVKGIVTAGQSLSLLSEEEILKVSAVGQKAKPEIFATRMLMTETLPITKGYVDAVTASRPIGYWRFESIEEGVVANEIAGGCSLKVIGNVHFTKTIGNIAAEFQPNSGGYLVSEPLKTLGETEYSMEAWVKPSHLHRGVFLALFSTDPMALTRLELQGDRHQSLGHRHPEVLRFVHHTSESEDEFGTSCFSKHRYLLRRWQHVVAVKDGGRMLLYIDGKLCGTARDPLPLTPVRRLGVGWDSLNKGWNFVGQLDEVAVYGRVLSEKEILEHYRSVDDSRDTLPSSNSDDSLKVDYHFQSLYRDIHVGETAT